MYTKIEMYSFADFYHRFCTVGLTLDEIFENWQKYSSKPRDINDPITVPKKLKESVIRHKPPATMLQSVLKQTCLLHNVDKSIINGKSHKREYAQIRQWVAYTGMEMGFKPPDFELILGWERSGIYHKYKKADVLASVDINYRESLNAILKMFGCDVIID